MPATQFVSAKQFSLSRAHPSTMLCHLFPSFCSSSWLTLQWKYQTDLFASCIRVHDLVQYSTFAVNLPIFDSWIGLCSITGSRTNPTGQHFSYLSHRWSLPFNSLGSHGLHGISWRNSQPVAMRPVTKAARLLRLATRKLHQCC